MGQLPTLPKANTESAQHFTDSIAFTVGACDVQLAMLNQRVPGSTIGKENRY